MLKHSIVLKFNNVETVEKSVETVERTANKAEQSGGGKV